jgi:ATP-dependent protease HslVU (ClpYQ) peptidase subunit
MGDDAISTCGNVRLQTSARATRRIERAVLVRDGQDIATIAGGGDKLDAEHADRPGSGFHWYY